MGREEIVVGYGRKARMDMSDDGGGGVGFGVLFDTGGGWIVALVLIGVMVILTLYCNAQEAEHQHRFCAEVCSQYGDAPVEQGSQCFCRDGKGIYDPATRPR